MSGALRVTEADESIRQCLDANRSFYVIAGAGSGKTTSLITALDHIRNHHGKRLRRDSQKVVCVTYTKRAVEVIASRLGWDDLFLVGTLHSFLWGEIKRYTPDIRRALKEGVLPAHIAKKQEEDNGGNSQRALQARERVAELTGLIPGLDGVSQFTYGDSAFSDYVVGELGHDDLIDVAARMIATNEQLRRIIGQKYPYIFVDEAQDTHEAVVDAINSVCLGQGLPIVGYFGDPMQQIYDKRAGEFQGPPGSLRIAKEENFRSTQAVVTFLNAFRTDIQQFAAGPNASVEGSVALRVVQTEVPGAPRGRYTPEQVDRAATKLDEAIAGWGWAESRDVKHLYLVRQMIARRLGFTNLQKLFTGNYASTRAQDDYEKGDHFLLRPFVTTLYRLIAASRANDHREMINILRENSPAFDPTGRNAHRTLSEMLELAKELISGLVQRWVEGNVGDVLRYSVSLGLCPVSERLSSNLSRARRSEEYVEEVFGAEKGEWLADEFLGMGLGEIENYCAFIAEQTMFSTQHGVKGEQYSRVLAVFDDVGSAWTNYSFSKLLTPRAAGEPTERQRRLSERLAYVCFSRAEVDLRIVLYSDNAAAARTELLSRGLFTSDQVELG